MQESEKDFLKLRSPAMQLKKVILRTLHYDFWTLNYILKQLQINHLTIEKLQTCYCSHTNEYLSTEHGETKITKQDYSTLLKEEAGSPSLLNKVPTIQFFQPYLTALGLLALSERTLTLLLTMLADAG